jgi:hypothetical protein
MILKAYFLDADGVECNDTISELTDRAFELARSGKSVRAYVDGVDGNNMILFDVEDIICFWNDQAPEDAVDIICNSWPAECGRYVIDGRNYVSPDDVFAMMFELSAIGLISVSGSQAVSFSEYLGTKMCESLSASYNLHSMRTKIDIATGGDTQ